MIPFYTFTFGMKQKSTMSTWNLSQKCYDWMGFMAPFSICPLQFFTKQLGQHWINVLTKYLETPAYLGLMMLCMKAVAMWEHQQCASQIIWNTIPWWQIIFRIIHFVHLCALNQQPFVHSSIKIHLIVHMIQKHLTSMSVIDGKVQNILVLKYFSLSIVLNTKR